MENPFTKHPITVKLLDASLKEKDVFKFNGDDIFPEDTIATFKARIYKKTNILPFKQYLYPVFYELRIDGQAINLKFERKQDQNLYRSRDNVEIVNNEMSVTLGSVFEKEYILVALDDVLLKYKDEYEMDLEYYSFILKYFPYLSLPAFKDYLTTPEMFNVSYSLLTNIEDDSSVLIDMYKEYTSLQDNFRQFYPEYLINKKVSTHKVISTKIVSITIHIPNESKEKVLDLLQLFIFIPLQQNVLLVKYDNLVKFRDNNVIKYYNIYERIIKISKFCILLSMQKYIILLQLESSGEYKIIFNINGVDVMLNEVAKYIAELVNPFIKHLNTMGRSIFTSMHRLDYISLDTLTYENLEIQIIWYKTISPHTFANIKYQMQDEISVGLIDVKKEDVAKIKLLYTKVPLNKTYEYIQNEFEYYTAEQHHTAILKTWQSQQMIVIEHTLNYMSFKFEVRDLDTFKLIYRFFVYLLCKLDSRIKSEVTTAIAAKSLKQQDPVLYDLKKYGTQNLYSRKCQKPNQPRIVSKVDAEKYGATKYWNFTNNTEEYYYCPNKKFQHFSFITGLHPLGYCLPCCKKTAPERKKKVVYEMCIKERVYEKVHEVMTQRHISKFGKFTESRLTYLPPLLQKYIDHTINKDAIYSIKNKKVFIDNKEYLLSHIKKIVKYSKVRQINTSVLSVNLTRKNITDSGATLNDILQFPTKYKIDMSKIKNTQIDKSIIIYKNIIIDGIYTYGNAVMNKRPTVNVKYLMQKQLERLAQKVGGADESRLTSTGFYIVGVDQNAVNASNVGMFYIMTHLMNITSLDLIKKIADVIKDDHIFNSLLGSKMKYYFKDAKHFLEMLHIVFIGDQQIPNSIIHFDFYNEVLISLLPYVCGVTPIIIEYNQQVEKFYINNFSRFSDLIIIFKYIDNNIMHNAKLPVYYYPIYMVILRDYFKSQEIERKIFTIEDAIIKSFIKLSKSAEVTAKYPISLIEEFKVPDVYYLNNSNICHSVGYDINGKKIVIPIDYTTTLSTKVTRNNTYDNLVDHVAFKQLIDEYNLFVIEKAELQGLVKSSNIEDMTLEQRYENIIAPYKLITFTTVLVNTNEIVIGLANDFYYYYFSTTLTPQKIATYFKVPLKLKRIMYAPNIINAEIKSFLDNPISSKYADKISGILYKKRMYALFCAHLFQYLDDTKKKLPTERDEFMKAVNDAAKMFTSHKPINWDSEVYAFKICNNEDIPYCDGTKLKITTNEMRQMIDLLYADYNNPLKKSYLLNSALINKIQNQYMLQKSNDQIYMLNS